ncbi:MULTISPECIES: transglutaminase-like cysteine peptidase [unclassified Bradyrhizobium]|uniref:transglutaminase-like cysteine peptidase n=1 Tax=unclassified Bradyrhizobium TaxID=2631580 RepID=UPI00291637CE|nr:MULTISPECIES: transglutaminase-like cysteine peptidase [unclassified Bradyrhizobium]
MNFLALMRASLVAAAASAAIWIGSPASAGPVAQPLGFATAIEDTAEPFGLPRVGLEAGALRDKWLALARKLEDERVQLALCDGDRERCVSPAALSLLAIIDQGRLRAGRARLGEINRAVNLAIRPASDLAQYGQVDVWASPLATFERRAGDCEDYAIAKFVALRMAGIASDDLRIVILHDVVRGEDHAVAAARLDGHWLMLDNQRMAMIQDSDARQVRPLFVIDETGISRYQALPLMAEVRALSPEGTASVNH